MTRHMPRVLGCGAVSLFQAILQVLVACCLLALLSRAQDTALLLCPYLANFDRHLGCYLNLAVFAKPAWTKMFILEITFNCDPRSLGELKS